MSLALYHEIVFALKTYHGWSVSEIESLLGYERAVYLTLVQQDVEIRKERARQGS